MNTNTPLNCNILISAYLAIGKDHCHVARPSSLVHGGPPPWEFDKDPDVVHKMAACYGRSARSKVVSLASWLTRIAEDLETEVLAADDAKQSTSSILSHSVDSIASLNRASVELQALSGMPAGSVLVEWFTLAHLPAEASRPFRVEPVVILVGWR